MANHEPFTFGNSNRSQEQTPHSGVHHDERPAQTFDNTTLPEAVEQGLIRTPTSPEALETPAPTEQATQIPRQHESWMSKHTRALASAVAGLVVVGGGVAVYETFNHHDKTSVGVKDKTDPVEGALAVDGNLFPEKANPKYDTVFGIRKLNNDGTIEPKALFKQIGVVEVPIATKDIGPLSETEAESTDHGREVLGKALDSYLPNFEAIANLYNMNNPEVQASRAADQALPEDQRLLLANADLASQFPVALSSYSSDNHLQVLPPSMVSAIGQTAPGDASLRAVACPFYGEAPAVCAQAQEEDPNFSQYSSAYDDKESGTEVQQDIGELSDGTMDREIRKNVNLSIVWVDATGAKVSTSKATFNAQIGTMGGNKGDLDNYLSFREY